MPDISDLFTDALTEMPWWLPFAVQAGGTVARQQGRRAVVNRQSQYLQQERQRQHALQGQADTALDANLQTFSRPVQDARQQATQARYEEALKPGGATGDYVASASAAAPTEVKTEVARNLTDALARGRDYAKRLAKVQSYGGAGLDNSIALGRSGEQLSQIGRNAQGSLDVLPFELDAAKNAGARWNMGSDIANGVGQALFLGKLVSPGKKRLGLTEAQAADGTIGGSF